MKTILIVFHSLTGGTRQMAEAASWGAASQAQVGTRLAHAVDAGPADVLAADGATPENLGAIAGPMRAFFDRIYYAALDHINGPPYATLICAGSEGHHAARQIERTVTGWHLKGIAEPLIVSTSAQTPEAIRAPKMIEQKDLTHCRKVETALAAGMATGIF